MADKHTYNLTMMFGVGQNIATIVCYHDDEIDKGLVCMIANSYIQVAIAQSRMRPVPPEEFLNIVNRGLQNDYPNLQTVVVKSDVVVAVTMRPNNRSSMNPNDPNLDNIGHN